MAPNAYDNNNNSALTENDFKCVVFRFVKLLSVLATILQNLIIRVYRKVSWLVERYELANIVIIIIIIIIIIMSINGS